MINPDNTIVPVTPSGFCQKDFGFSIPLGVLIVAIFYFNEFKSSLTRFLIFSIEL